jgi:hypothetical protein
MNRQREKQERQIQKELKPEERIKETTDRDIERKGIRINCPLITKRLLNITVTIRQNKLNMASASHNIVNVG